jgi:Guanylate-binding protein, N-terminal domain
MQEDHLQHLELFSEVGKKVHCQGTTASNGTASTFKPLQKLDFLVRDWCHFKQDDPTADEMQQEFDAYLKRQLTLTGLSASLQVSTCASVRNM